MKLGIVIPTLNESNNLLELLPKIRELYPRSLVIVVDDQSIDSTVLVAKGYRALVPHSIKIRGLALSYIEGLARACFEHDCDIVVQMDADHPLVPIPAMVEKLINEKLDMVIGHELVTRQITSMGASWLSRTFLGLEFAQPTCGLVVYSAKFLRRIGLGRMFSRGDAFHVEILLKGVRIRARIKEMDFYGKSHEKASFKRVFRWLLDFGKLLLWRLFH